MIGEVFLMDQKPDYEELVKRVRDLEKETIKLKRSTEPKRAEDELRKYEQIVAQSRDHMAFIDRNYIYQMVNDIYLIAHQKEREDIVGHSIVELFGPELFYQQLKAPIDRCLAGEEVNYQSWFDYPGLGQRYIDVVYFPFIEEGKTVSGVVVSSRDITETRKLKDQLRQTQKMESIGTLVAGVAHEVNNPINTITLNLPLLKRIWHDFQPVLKAHAEREPQRKYGGLTFEYLAEKLPRLLSGMDIAANRVARIATGLKDFARQSNIVENKSIRINAAVKNTLLLAQSTLGKSSVELVLKLADNLPSMMGDLQSMEQIILNLILNAIQAIDHNQGRIKITTGIKATEGKIYISVSDNGRGIDPSISDKIFDPFVTTQQAEGGTGLGLSVTYNLVKAQGGEITFQSQEGKGTVFTVVFPVKLGEKAAKILIVDDDEPVRSAIILALTQNRPCVVEAAASGTEALIKLGTQRPDLLILDIFMPEMDGLEVCRVLKNEPGLSDMKVVIITGFPENPKLEEIVAMGYTHIMEKPLDLHNMLKTVDELLK